MDLTKSKDEKYQDMLKKIELNVEKKVTFKDTIDDKEKQNKSDKPDGESKLSIMDLLGTIENADATQNTSLMKNQLTNLNAKADLLKEIPSIRKKENIERKANATIVDKEVKKWQNVIKKNRETDHLNFVEKPNVSEFRINAALPESKTKTELETKMESKLKEFNLFDEEDAINQDKELLKSMPTKEAKEKTQTETRF